MEKEKGNKNKYQTIPESRNRESQPYQKKQAAEMPDKGTQAWRNRAFTLIELLVVVLIIGILAAVAVPQYQKAVEKTKATNLLALLKPIAQAVRVYELNNNTFPASLDELDISLSDKQKTKFLCNDIGSCSNEEYGIGLYSAMNGYQGVFAVRTSGNYRGGGFIIFTTINHQDLQPDTLYCYERAEGDNKFNLNRGDYCKKLFNGTWISSYTTNAKLFSLP